MMSEGQRDRVTRTLEGMSDTQLAEMAHAFAVASNYSAGAVDLLSMALRIGLDPMTSWQPLHIDVYMPCEPKPGRQQRRKRAWSLHR